MPAAELTLPTAELEAFCQRHHIRRLRLFGSALGPDFRADSDADFLVEFEENHTPGWHIVSIADELSGLLGGRPVDLVNPRYLKPRFKESILASARVVYQRADAAA